MIRPLQLASVVVALLALSGCDKTIFAPELRRTIIGAATPTYLRITNDADDSNASTPIRVLTTGSLRVYGTERAELFFTDGPCSLSLTVPLQLGIHPIRAGSQASGSFDCAALGATDAPLRGEVAVWDINTDYQIGRVVLSMGMGRVRWEGSGTTRLAGDVNIVAFDPPPAPSGSGTPGTVDLSNCSALPSGYQCVTVSGTSARVWYQHPKGPTGWYRNTGLDACINFASSGTSTVVYTGGSRTTETRKWGVLVDTNGKPTGPADGSVLYVYTGASDPQIVLLNFVTATRSWVQGGWSVGSC